MKRSHILIALAVVAIPIAFAAYYYFFTTCCAPPPMPPPSPGAANTSQEMAPKPSDSKPS